MSPAIYSLRCSALHTSTMVLLRLLCKEGMSLSALVGSDMVITMELIEDDFYVLPLEKIVEIFQDDEALGSDGKDGGGEELN